MAPQVSQGFITVTPHSWKSVTFRVAKAAPESRTMAAICASNWEIGLPVFCRSAAIRAYNGAASEPNGKIRPLKSFSNIAWAAASRLSRLRPWGSSNKPCSNYVKKPYCKNARYRAFLRTNLSPEMAGQRGVITPKIVGALTPEIDTHGTKRYRSKATCP